MTQKEEIELAFAKKVIQMMDDYQEKLLDSKNVKDREFNHMNRAIYGCKILVQNALNGETEVELDK